MTFIWPYLLYLLLGVPLLVWFYVRMQKRRREFAARYGSLGIAQPEGKPTKARSHLPAITFFIGITILILSVARPQAYVSLPKLEGTVMLAFDVSGSMAADDLKPTRMDAAKEAAKKFVEKQPSTVVIGVVAFSDGGIAVQPPTNVKDDIFKTIDRLAPQRGTSLGNGMLVALNAIAVNAGNPSFLSTNNLDTSQAPEAGTVHGWYPSSVIVMLTDGENNVSPDPTNVTDLAADLGVRVYTIGIGSVNGAVLNVEGFSVHSKLDEDLLKYISDTTGGKYYNADNEEDLNRIYSDLQPQLRVKAETTEVTSLFAGAGILFLLIGGISSLFWFGHLP
jgi:Ca-activated chloride channel family protein